MAKKKAAKKKAAKKGATRKASSAETASKPVAPKRSAVKVEANGSISIYITIGRKRYPALMMTGCPDLGRTSAIRDEMIGALDEALS